MDGDLIYGDGMNIAYNDSRPGNDIIEGFGGNDTIYGGIGANTIDGGDGNDLIYAANLDTYETAGPGMLYGGNGDDTIMGASKNDYIEGGSGYDHISGGDGDDTILGGTDDDYINGGEGNDHIQGGIDNDTINGDAGNDTIFGESGNDSIYGGNGDDYLVGGAGADTIDGGNGNDTVAFSDATIGITLNLADSSQNTGDATGDVYKNVEAFIATNYGDTMIADSSGVIFAAMGGNDFLNGGVGNDYLDGGEGDDALLGNGGADTLVGGTGNDVYGVTASSGIDIIVENANQGIDTVLFRSDVAQLGLARQGNDLIFVINNDTSTLAVLAGWFTNKGTEYVQLQNGPTYSVQDLVNAYMPSASGKVAAASANALVSACGETLVFDATHAEQIDFSEILAIDIIGTTLPNAEMLF